MSDQGDGPDMPGFRDLGVVRRENGQGPHGPMLVRPEEGADVEAFRSDAVERLSPRRPKPAPAVDEIPLEDEGLPEETPVSREAVEFGVHVAMRYHARRRVWYDGFHRGAALVLALAGSSCVIAIAGGLLHAAELLALGVAAAGALELAFDFSGHARLEDALYRRFNALACEMAASGATDEAELRRWNAQRLLVKSDGDERLEALRRVCHDLEAEARGYGAGARYELWGWQRLFAQVVSLPPLRPMGARARRRAGWVRRAA